MHEEDYIVKFYKEPGRDLVILNLADVQFNDLFDLFGNRNMTVETIKRLVERVKPDLITLTGDQVWGFRTKSSLRFLCRLMDGFGVPWAPVLGNHDCSGRADKEYTAAHYRKSELCLFRKDSSFLLFLRFGGKGGIYGARRGRREGKSHRLRQRQI